MPDIRVSLDERLHRDMKMVAAQEGMTVADFVREGIKSMVNGLRVPGANTLAKRFEVVLKAPGGKRK